MNLEEMRKRAQEITAPTTVVSETPSFESFVDMLRQSEMNERRRLKFYTIIMCAVGVTLFASAIVQGSPGVTLIAVVYAIVATLALRKVHQLKGVNYTRPTGEFLREARNRYRFWGWKETLAAIPGLALLAVGGGLVVQRMAEKYFDLAGQAVVLWVYAAFFALVVILGFLFAWSDWKRSKGKIMAEIRRMESELMNG